MAPASTSGASVFEPFATARRALRPRLCYPTARSTVDLDDADCTQAAAFNLVNWHTPLIAHCSLVIALGATRVHFLIKLWGPPRVHFQFFLKNGVLFGFAFFEFRFASDAAEIWLNVTLLKPIQEAANCTEPPAWLF